MSTALRLSILTENIMTQRQQHFDQDSGQSRRKSFRTAKGCWTALLSAGLLFAQLSPVCARHPFNSPVVPGYPSPRTVRPVVPVPRPVRPAPPVRRVVPPAAPIRPVIRPPAVVRRPLPVGRVIRTLPLGYAAIMLANSLYYYHAGSFYRRAPGGYVVINSPVGAVVPALPADYSFLTVDGVRYYIHAGTYYLPAPGGYQVVADPRRTAPQPVVSNKVIVTSNILNVRSGPGLQHHIAARAYYGDHLLVLHRKADWIFVQLPDNSRGWVMTRFTAPAGGRADG